MNATVAPRAPRLTLNRLEDLAELQTTIADEVAYLDSALQHPQSPALKDFMTKRRGRLVRSGEWLNGKIEAERARRGVQA